MEFLNLNREDLPALMRLYNESFPPSERRLYESENELLQFVEDHKDLFEVFLIRNDFNEFVGFCSYWKFPEFTYIEHLAIEKEWQRRGLGTKAVKHVITMGGPKVLIEVEPPTTPEAKERIEFYKRLQFRVRNEVDYIQPPYSSEQRAVPMLIMTHGDVSLADGMDSLRPMLKHVYNVK